MTTLRPECKTSAPGTPCPKNGTAYLMILNAVKTKDGLIHGRLHYAGRSCAIGSFFDVNDKMALPADIIDEVAAVNDSAPNGTPKQRKLMVAKWLRWKLKQLGM